MINWKLNENHFTWLDRLKICKFFLNVENFWTYGKYVKKFENEMAKYIGVKHALFVSSGSTANTVLAYYLSTVSTKKKIIFPSVTWATSITPFIKCGFEPIFVDVKLNNLSADLDEVENILKTDNDVALIFVTSLLGISPDIDKLKSLESKYGVRIMLDNCESTFSSYNGKNISSYFTSTTSTYFGHLLQSVEGGFVFTNDDSEYEMFNMIRNHGMYRHLEPQRAIKYKNDDVDPKFDFYTIGNNFRNSDIHAFIGLLDFVRIPKYIKQRKKCYELFTKCLDKTKYSTIDYNEENVMFSLPIICKSREDLQNVKNYCEKNNIEYRPIVGSNILRQTAFKEYSSRTYENADTIHTYGIYVGLHYSVDEKTILKFCSEI
jgi:CDP-6-deoxy-D-xylo-4-hexulose-3-dehydrase